MPNRPTRSSLVPLLLLASVCRVAPAQQVGADWSPSAPALELATEEVGALPPSVRATPLEGGRWRLRVALASRVRAENVALAGGFNGWSQTEHPMKRGADGRWSVELDVPSGVWSYKFVVDGARWIADPDNPDREPDGFGAENAVLRLGALGRPDALEGERGDGEVVTVALEHDPGRSLYLQRTGDRALVRYRTLDGDVDAVTLEVEPDGSYPMVDAGRSGAFRLWQVEVPLAEAKLRYGFVLVDGGERASDPRLHVLDPDALLEFTTPDWAKNATWYQVFAERFRNGDPSNDPPRTRPWTSDWDVPAEWEGADGQTFWEYYVFQRMYGGDLAGVRDQLDHIQSLGVDALYFNPIFAAEGSHKYNATDYRHIDPGFGAGEDLAEATRGEDLKDPSTWVWTPSDRLFLELLAECKARGIRVVLDGVFNHVGVRHPAFVDVRESGEDSRFADWFEILSFEPFRYAGWAGFGELPVFAKNADGLASAEVEQHVFDVTRRWMDPDGDGDPSDGIDGWRLDVPMEIAMPFWERWRVVVKSANPDAYITGEVWDRADTWLDGKRFDAVMNYQFAETAIEWIGNDRDKITASEADRRLAELRLAYPREATYAMMNLVDSHDTDRLVSMLKNPDRSYDRENRVQDGSPYDGSKPDPVHYRRARLVALLQMTYVGAPMVYYGDEVGMWGADDPVNRKPMLWADVGEYANDDDRVDAEHLAHYRAVGMLRREHAALRVGSFRTLRTDDDADLWVFERALGEEALVVALNAGSAPAALSEETLDGVEVLFGELDDGRVPPIAGVVLRRR
ncbi:MAG: alpha amylase N-terminal ig-like domain-containing protein [Planctomycetota bacterium]